METGQQARAAAYLEAQKKVNDRQLQQEWETVEMYFKNKLWTEMTGKLETLVQNPKLQNEKSMREFYEYFVGTVDTRLNPFGLVVIMEVVTGHIKDKRLALKMLENIEEKVKICEDALRYAKLLRGSIYLKDFNNLTATKQIIDELRDVMEAEGHVTEVHGKYYILAAEYYRRVGNHNDFYRTGLMYLGCANDQLPVEQWPEMAVMLSISALLGDKIFNMGELLLHPILNSIADTPNAYLIELLAAYHSGDVEKFYALRPMWSKQQDLLNSELILRQKISLAALMELTFRSIGKERALSFKEIAKAAKLPMSEVEFLILKAFALELVKGSIDQVAGVVHMRWVRPRTLNQKQIKTLCLTVDNWLKSISEMEKQVEQGADEIIKHEM